MRGQICITFALISLVSALPYPSEEPEMVTSSDNGVVEDSTIVGILRPGSFEESDDTVVIESSTGTEEPMEDDWEVFSDISECGLEVEKGPCRAIIDAWFYNPVSEACEFFSWSGCGGNANRFRSIDTCMSKCQGFVTNSSSTTPDVEEMAPLPSSTEAAAPETSTIPKKKSGHTCPKFNGCPSKKCTIVQEASNRGCKRCQCAPEGDTPFTKVKEDKRAKENSAEPKKP